MKIRPFGKTGVHCLVLFVYISISPVRRLCEVIIDYNNSLGENLENEIIRNSDYR